VHGLDPVLPAKSAEPEPPNGTSGRDHPVCLPGSINGAEGGYQIFTRPSFSGNVELIMHRFFVPY